MAFVRFLPHMEQCDWRDLKVGRRVWPASDAPSSDCSKQTSKVRDVLTALQSPLLTVTSRLLDGRQSRRRVHLQAHVFGWDWARLTAKLLSDDVGTLDQ